MAESAPDGGRSNVKQREQRSALTGPTIWILVALAAITVAVYAPVRHFDFVSIDDSIYVTDNPHLRGGFTWEGVASVFTSSYAAFWHPLTMLSLMLDVQLFGMNAGAFHVTNLVLHVASTLILFLALFRMTGARGRSAFVAALFAVHPLHVESVAWIAERKDVLSTCFWMLTLWAYIGYVQTPTRVRYGLVVVSLALGLMAKPMLVTLPFALLLLDWWPLGRVSLSAARVRDGRRPGMLRAWLPLFIEKVPLVALSVAAGVAAILAQQRGGAVATIESFSMSGRIANALVAYVTYIGKMIWPHALVVFYPYARAIPVWPAVAAFAALSGASLLVAWLASRRPYLAVGWLWYLGTLLPVSGLVQVGSHAMADRYTYVPLVGLFIMVAWGVPEALGGGRIKRVILSAAAAGAVMACAVAARAQVMTWQDSVTLWQHTLRVMPDNYFAHNALGLEWYKQGRASEASASFLRSMELAPGFPNPYNNLGLVLAEQGRTAEAIDLYHEALQRWPDYPQAHGNLGKALLTAGRPQEAIGQFNEALRLSHDRATAHTGLGNALLATGQFDEAIRQYEDALRLAPGVAATHYNLGIALLNMGRAAEAERHLREAVGLKPDYAEAHMNLGTALFSMGRLDAALGEHSEAVRLDPGSANAHYNLASTLDRMGRPAEAALQYEDTLRLEGDSADVHLALGGVVERLGRVEDALSHYREALRLKPDSAAAGEGLARTTALLGKRRRR